MKAKVPSMPTLESELKAATLRINDMERGFGIDEGEKMKLALAEESKKRLQRDTNDMRQSLMRPECRRVIYRVIEESKAFASSFVPGHSDMTAFNEGQRSVGLFVLKLAELAEPGVCLKMAREDDSDRISREQKHSQIITGETNADR
jgi:hypothetical protein